MYTGHGRVNYMREKRLFIDQQNKQATNLSPDLVNDNGQYLFGDLTTLLGVIVAHKCEI